MARQGAIGGIEGGAKRAKGGAGDESAVEFRTIWNAIEFAGHAKILHLVCSTWFQIFRFVREFCSGSNLSYKGQKGYERFDFGLESFVISRISQSQLLFVLFVKRPVLEPIIRIARSFVCTVKV